MSFDDALSAAIDDLLRNGYDSAERLAYWQSKLREAAEAVGGSTFEQERRLREALERVYRRLIDRGGVFRHHPGVTRFTVDRIRPDLRSELQRRIHAGADLIRLNRPESIDKTLRRFVGWGSSVPPGGGVSEDTKRAIKAEIKKPLRSMSFTERRVAIDQGHKLAANINDLIGRAGDAIAVKWHSHWRQPGYNYRVDHKERDGNVYLLRDSWAKRAGLVKPDSAGYYDDITAVGQEPFCRCYVTYLYHLRQLPDDMITEAGREKLRVIRAA